MSETNQSESAAEVRSSSTLVCPKCGTDKCASSRTQSTDRLRVSMLPLRPIRCLRCYHRFWVREPLLANTNRKRFYLVVVALIIGLVFILLIALSNNNQQASFTEVEDQMETSSQSDIAPLELSQSNSLEQLENHDSVTTYRSQQIQKAKDLKDDLQQIELARQAATTARQEQLAKQALLDSLIDSEEAQSLVKIELKSVVEQWRDAWQAGQIQRYLSYYSDDFVPDGDRSLEQWKKLRRLRVSPERKIVLQLSDFDIQMEDGNAIVDFRQKYQAGDFNDVSRKRLVLSNDGYEWKIIREQEI